MATVIDGNALARELRGTIEDELQALRKAEAPCGLATVMVGDDPSALAYERQMRRLAEGLDYRYVNEHLPPDVGLDDMLATIGALNADPWVSGILVLRPLPPHLPEAEINRSVDPMKDVEAQHPENAGLLAFGRPRFLPSTPAACYHLLDAHVRSIGEQPDSYYADKTLVVVGRSTSVGKPAQWLGLERNATVIACHSRTAAAGRLPEFTRQADILIVAAGVPELVTGDMVSEGVIAVDVGFHVVKDDAGASRMVGDLEYEGVRAKAAAITPVPGGVGPITDVWLVGNSLAAAALAAGIEPRFGPGAGERTR